MNRNEPLASVTGIIRTWLFPDDPADESASSTSSVGTTPSPDGRPDQLSENELMSELADRRDRVANLIDSSVAED